MATEAIQAAKIAKAVTGDLRRAFATILKEHGALDWELESFSLKKTNKLLEGDICPPDQEYDCRAVGVGVICKCWPRT